MSKKSLDVNASSINEISSNESQLETNFQNNNLNKKAAISKAFDSLARAASSKSVIIYFKIIICL